MITICKQYKYVMNEHPSLGKPQTMKDLAVLFRERSYLSYRVG
jgi:hypothetical protein